MLKVENLSKNFNDKTAVDDISFEVKNGKVVGFLGPNGAGKTTAIKVMLGLERPSAGEALIDGHRYHDLENPLGAVGALIDTGAFHKSRSARNHLLAIALTAGIPVTRVDEVLEMVGLSDVANKPVGKFSLGMTQRVGIAAAILGEPKNLILDEPVNGLDPEGIIWVREFCKAYAQAGNAVFISSHLMSEVEHTVDEVIIIGRGKIIDQGTLAAVLKRSAEKTLEDAFIKLTNSTTEYQAGKLPKFGENRPKGANETLPKYGGKK